MLSIRFSAHLLIAVASVLLLQPVTVLASDDYTIHKCRIIEIRKRGEIESNRYIIRGFSQRGRLLETFKSVDGRPFSGLAEAELGLFLLIDEGNCPG